MKEPFIFDRYRENFIIGVENLADVTMDIASYADQEVKNIDAGAGNRIIEFNTNDTLSGNPAFNITYKLDDGLQVKITEKGTNVGDKVYFLVYRTEAPESRGLPKEIKALIDSVKKERLKAYNIAYKQVSKILVGLIVVYGLLHLFSSDQQILNLEKNNIIMGCL